MGNLVLGKKLRTEGSGLIPCRSHAEFRSMDISRGFEDVLILSTGFESLLPELALFSSHIWVSCDIMDPEWLNRYGSKVAVFVPMDSVPWFRHLASQLENRIVGDASVIQARENVRKAWDARQVLKNKAVGHMVQMSRILGDIATCKLGEKLVGNQGMILGNCQFAGGELLALEISALDYEPGTIEYEISGSEGNIVLDQALMKAFHMSGGAPTEDGMIEKSVVADFQTGRLADV